MTMAVITEALIQKERKRAEEFLEMYVKPVYLGMVEMVIKSGQLYMPHLENEYTIAMTVFNLLGSQITPPTPLARELRVNLEYLFQ